ncbi:MAG: phosphoribosyl-ATP diphosphatase [Spirochaetales bacterium]|nr:phosphoribosyl-ATP diphosphatase [Spirochaetales bacterium]
MAYLAKGEKAENCGKRELKIVAGTEDVQLLGAFDAFNEGTSEGPSGNENENESGVLSGSGILPRLAGVIAKRHEDMPEGSYTTHLFKSGADKIRKKLGEEAVEVILAREKKDVVYESADLIYHLLVLLESLDVPLNDVFKELESRE